MTGGVVYYGIKGQLDATRILSMKTIKPSTKLIFLEGSPRLVPTSTAWNVQWSQIHQISIQFIYSSIEDKSVMENDSYCVWLKGLCQLHVSPMSFTSGEMYTHPGTWYAAIDCHFLYIQSERASEATELSAGWINCIAYLPYLSTLQSYVIN